MNTPGDAWNARYAKVIARAWTDEAFKARLLSDPASALADMGIRVPLGVTVRVLENVPGTVHLVLPQVPFEGDLSDYDLEKLAAADTPTGFCCSHDCLVAEELP
jgi:hypothetical protein